MWVETPSFEDGFTLRSGTIKLVNDPPATHGSDSLTSEVQLNWRRRKIGRPGKEDGAMETSLDSANNIDISL